MKILEVADRPGWAIDRLSKPLSHIYDNVDICYFSISENRFLASGYSDKIGNKKYEHWITGDYDIIHYHRAEAAYKDLEFVKGRKILSIHTERTEDYDDERLEQFDDIICPTRFAYHYLKNKNLNINVHYVPYGVEIGRFIGLRYNIKSNCTGYVGRVVPWKRYSLAQKASNEAGMKLLACGYIEKGELRNVYNFKEGIDFEYQSFIPENLMPMFYERMEIFLCLSEPHIEAGPLPVIEAMAAGIPVISTRVGWAADHCEHLENIIFIDEEEIDYLPNVIKQLKSDNGLKEKLSASGKKLSLSFSTHNYVNNVMSIYNS